MRIPTLAGALLALLLALPALAEPTPAPVAPAAPAPDSKAPPADAVVTTPVVPLPPPPPAPWIVPAGRESQLLRMLGAGAALPGGCSLQGAAIERVLVRATYACTTGEVVLLLQHPDEGTGAVAKTDRFALAAASGSLPEGLVPALIDRLRAEESTWEWVRGSRDPNAPPPPEPTPDGNPAYPAPELPADQQAEYDAAEALIKANRLEEALDRLVPLARKAPISKVLGLVVVALAPRATDEERVRKEQAAADAAPTDPLLNLRAGVITHYAGHKGARTRDLKSEYYRKALLYLNRTLPAYNEVSRTWIYTAVSHFRLGHQAEAEAAIDKAILLSEKTGDADAWYCRAEVWHRKDVKRSLEDIDRYIQIMKVNVAQGAIHSPAKDARVLEMKARLEKVASSAEPLRPDEELFDPLPDGPAPFASGLPGGGPSTLLMAGVALALGIVIAVAIAAFRRRRK